MQDQQDLTRKVKELISANQTARALELLAKEQLSDIDRQVIMLNNRYNKVIDDQRLGIIDDHSARLELNKINLSLLDLAESIDKKPKGVSSDVAVDQAAGRKSSGLIKLGIGFTGLVLMGFLLFRLFVIPNEKHKQYEVLLNKADSLYSHMQYEQAKAKYEAVLKFDISDKAYAERKIDTCENRIKYLEMYDEGKAMEAEKKWQDALAKYKLALTIYGEGKEASQGVERVEAAITAVKNSWEEKFIDKYTVFKDAETGKVLTALGSQNASELQLGDYRGEASQLFKLVRLQDGLFALECKIKYGQILTTSRTDYNSTIEYSKPGPLWLYQWAAGDQKPGGNQTWKMISLGDNKFRIQNNNSDLYIGESSGKIFQLSKGECKTWLLYLEGEKQK